MVQQSGHKTLTAVFVVAAFFFISCASNGETHSFSCHSDSKVGMASKKKKSEVQEELTNEIEEKAEQRETTVIYSKEDCFDGNAPFVFH